MKLKKKKYKLVIDLTVEYLEGVDITELKNLIRRNITYNEDFDYLMRYTKNYFIRGYDEQLTEHCLRRHLHLGER